MQKWYHVNTSNPEWQYLKFYNTTSGLLQPIPGFMMPRMSREGGSDVAVDTYDCVYMTQTSQVYKHRFSNMPIDKTSSVEE